MGSLLDARLGVPLLSPTRLLLLPRSLGEFGLLRLNRPCLLECCDPSLGLIDRLVEALLRDEVASGLESVGVYPP